MKIARTIIEAELSNKHRKLNFIRRELVHKVNQLKNSIGYISFCTLNKVVNKTINGKEKGWSTTHKNKLSKLFEENNPYQKKELRPKNIVHNFSSYILSAEEEHVLSYGLDHQISVKMNKNAIKTEFEAFYCHLQKQFSNLSPNAVDTIKSKIRRSCKNYYNIDTSEQLHKTIDKLSKNNEVVVLKQGKGRGVVILDKDKYKEKCMNHLQTFQKTRRR